MALVTDTVSVSTRGDSQMIDITDDLQEILSRHGFREGAALVFVSGSTAGLTTVEYEPGLLEDLPAAFDRIAPRGIRYKHEETWHDGNGHSHVRASLLGPSLTSPSRTAASCSAPGSRSSSSTSTTAPASGTSWSSSRGERAADG